LLRLLASVIIHVGEKTIAALDSYEQCSIGWKAPKTSRSNATEESRYTRLSRYITRGVDESSVRSSGLLLAFDDVEREHRLRIAAQ
jgi:hypothetical protein